MYSYILACNVLFYSELNKVKLFKYEYEVDIEPGRLMRPLGTK